LDGAADGMVSSAADLEALPSKIKVDGTLSFGDGIPIPAALREAILNGLHALVSFAGVLNGNSLFQQKLPIVNKTLAEVLDLAGRIHTTLEQPIQEYFAGDSTPTVQELVTVLEQQIPSFTRDLTGSNNQLFKFDLDLTASRVVHDLAID